MKKAVIITSAVLVLATAGTVTALNQPQTIKESIVPTTIEAPQEPEKVETVKETPKKVEAPQKVTQVTEPEELATPSIEDLIIEYGWSKSPYRESIGFIMGNLPQYFTENKREASFKYLYDICESNTDERLNISFCFTFLRAQGWTEKAWDDLVKIPALESKLFD